MSQPLQWYFGSFRLDVVNACIWSDHDRIALPPKPFAVLAYLVAHAGQLVTKAALLEAVWPETSVNDTVLKMCVVQIRKALGDQAQSPRFVATVHRRGYRFIASVTTGNHAQADCHVALTVTPTERASTESLIEREDVMAGLYERLEWAREGARQVVVLSGEAGIGKTSVVNAFLSQVRRDGQVRCVAGQCIEHYGAGEAYLPILEVLGRLCHGAVGEPIVSLLRQHAPTWLVQMPWLLKSSDRALMQHEHLGVTRERMLRELTEALETLTRASPLVLVLEDLHWSDYATLDLLTFLARRQELAQLLLIATYRPADAIANDHPLRAVIQTLGRYPNYSAYPLALLSEAGVAAYLQDTVAPRSVTADMVRILHQRTDGNPLFLMLIGTTLKTQVAIHDQDESEFVLAALATIASQVPDGLRDMIEQVVDRHPLQVQQLLEVASVMGAEFSVEVVAAVSGEEVHQIEAECERLVRQQQLLCSGSFEAWPNGRIAVRYRFRHALYQQVIYDRLGVGRRVGLHQQIGSCLEQRYGSRAGEIAAELALHFREGRTLDRAAPFLLQAAQNAMHRQAYQEASNHLTSGLEVLQSMPDTPERHELELGFLMVQRVVLGTLKGFRAQEMESVLSRVQALYQQVEDIPPFAMSFWMGLWVWYFQKSNTLRTAQEVAARYLAIAQRHEHEEHILRASQALGSSYLVLGAPTEARVHLERALAMYDSERHSPAVIHTTLDPGVSSYCWMGLALWLLGYPEQAINQCREGLNLARQLAHPYSEAFALAHLARRYRDCGDYREAQHCIGLLMSLCAKHELGDLARSGRFLAAWSLFQQGQVETGIGQMRQTVESINRREPLAFATRNLMTLAAALKNEGQFRERLQLIDQALNIVAKSDGHYHEAELLRLKGDYLLQQPEPDTEQAEKCFHEALDIGHRQALKAFELRIAMSQSRLWHQQGRSEEALALLTSIYNWFTEGDKTADLQAAQSLLGDLRGL